MTNPGNRTDGTGTGWRTRAACHGHDPALWFPDWSLNTTKPRGPTDAWSYSPDAADICLTCPVAGPCLDYALHRNVDGIWSATTPIERRHLRNRHGITPITDDHDDHEEPAA